MIQYDIIFETHLRLFFSSCKSLNHKKSSLGQPLSRLAPVLLVVWIDGRSILAAGDNHSVSASTDPNSYLCLPTANMPQMTTETHIFSLLFQKPQGRECVFTYWMQPLQPCATVSSTGWTHSPGVHLCHTGICLPVLEVNALITRQCCQKFIFYFLFL